MRILAPSDYGLLAMATVIITFLALFAEMGIGGAVVQARDVDLKTMRSVFGLVVLVNLGLFLLTVLLAPLISAFYGHGELTLICQAIALQFLIGAPAVLPDAQLQRKLEFKWRSIIDLTAVVVQSGTTLALALNGFGVWSLVLSSLIGSTWRVIGLNVLSPFLHWPSFNFKGLNKLFSFGGYVVLARILGNASSQADTLIGGRVLGQEQVGYYSVGMDLASLPMQRVAAIMNTVAFPAVATIQHETGRVANYLVQGMRLLNLLTFPVFWGLASVAPEFVRVLLGSKWESAIVPLQLLALVVPVRMIWQIMPPILLGMGMARLVAWNHVVLMVGMVSAFLFGVQYGVVGLSAAWLLMFPLVFCVNVSSWLKVLNLKAGDFMKAARAPAIAAAGMCASIAAARTVDLGGNLSTLAALIAVGAFSYVALIWLLDRDSVRGLRAVFKS